MKIKYLSVVLLTTFITLPAISQVRLGQSSIAEKGAVLDLSSSYVGGMKLPNVNITDLGKIPAGFTETTVQDQDVNSNLTGMIVYNTNTTTGVGVYSWDGDNWKAFNAAESLLPGVPSDWVDTNGASGDGSFSSFYTNACPTANVTITGKAGYTLFNCHFGTISGNTATFPTVGNGWVTVMKDGKKGIIYVKVISCSASAFTCGSNGTALGLVVGSNVYQTHQYATGTNGEMQCWMVDNSKEGTSVSSQGFNCNGKTVTGTDPGACNATRGWFYTGDQANLPNNACPEGWSLPTEDQFNKLFGLNGETKVIGAANSTTNDARFWYGSGSNGSAFAGNFFITGDGWGNWGTASLWYVSGTANKFYVGSSTGLLSSGSNVTNWGSVRCVKSDNTALPGSITDWVTTNGATGNGTPASSFANVCPTANVIITAKSGYTLSNAVNGTISGNVATFSTVGSGSVTVTKDGKTGMVYVTVQQPCLVADCGYNGTATTLTVGSNTYLTHQYATGTSGENQCWMVSNSKEGTPSSTTFGSTTTTPNPSANGYYYTYTQAATACPTGWHVSNTTELTNLQTIINGNLASAQAKWWVTNENNAFAGLATSSGTNWFVSGEIGYWWSSTTASRNFFANTNGLDGEHNIDNNYWFSVRCVKNN